MNAKALPYMIHITAVLIKSLCDPDMYGNIVILNGDGSPLPSG